MFPHETALTRFYCENHLKRFGAVTDLSFNHKASVYEELGIRHNNRIF